MSFFIHGDNIEGKIRTERNEENKRLLCEIKSEYEKWRKENLKIAGISKEDIAKKVKLLNQYKNFIDQPKFKKEKGRTTGFIHQDKLHSTVIEEFLYYLFKDIKKLQNKKINLGRMEAYSNLYFAPRNIDSFENNAEFVVNVKEQDFSISKEVIIKSRVSNSENWKAKEVYVPIISIECKTYLDKTMLDGAIANAEKIKRGNPYCKFLIVTEAYNVSLEVDPKHSLMIDQIYVLRKQKRKSKQLNLIFDDLVFDLFKFVESHINADWYNVEKMIETGKMI